MKRKAITFILLAILLFPVSAWAGLTKNQVSQLYVSIFGRASEGEGNAYWQSQPDMATAASAMLNTDAARNYFGANLNTNQAFIEHIYLNTLNKTISDDFDGISYWVNMLNAGTSRGQAVATLVGAINDYAPDGLYYDPNDAATVAAYNQFTNRVEVCDYMADNVWDTPEDWQTSTSFSHGLVVNHDPATAYAAMVVVNGFLGGPVPSSPCGAYVAPGVWKEFDCYNLAAIGKTTDDDPFTPSWRLIGGYWQWGRKGPDPGQWYDTNTPNFAHGPTGPGSGEANEGSISGWDNSHAPNGSWSDSQKTANDPCPTGYRVPTTTQWDGVISNNAQNIIGSWSTTYDEPTNYSSARFFGNKLMLPAAGLHSSGALFSRGGGGYYWSSSESDSLFAWYLALYSSDAATNGYFSRLEGHSIRCVSVGTEPVVCTYSISPSTGSFSSESQSATVTVTTSDSNCKWTALENLSWVSLSPISRTGSGSVTITVGKNTGAARSGSVFIAGQTYTVSQTAPPPLNPIQITELNTFLTEIDRIYRSWKDAMRLALVTPRFRITDEIRFLQSLKNDLEDIYVPQDATTAYKKLNQAMGFAIEGFYSFAASNDLAAELFLSSSDDREQEYLTEIEVLKSKI